MRVVISIVLASGLTALAPRAQAGPITIGVGTGYQEGFTYSGDGLDATPYPALAAVFPNVLPISDYPSQAHNANSYVQFGLSQLTGLSASQIASATLVLQGVTGAVGFVGPPTTSNSVQADLYQVTSSWNPATLSWDVAPSVTAISATNITLSSGSAQASFDVTSIVQSWLANSGTNFGLMITQHAIVNGGSVGMVFDSGTATSGQPFLLVTLATPEPSSVVLALSGLVGLTALCWLRRKRQATA